MSEIVASALNWIMGGSAARTAQYREGYADGQRDMWEFIRRMERDESFRDKIFKAFGTR